MRILLGILIVVSIGIFANSWMRFNEMQKKAEELERVKLELTERREELEELIGSKEQASALLRCYAEYQELLAANTEENLYADLIAEKRAELDALLENAENREYVERIAKEYLDLQHYNATLYPTDIPN